MKFSTVLAGALVTLGINAAHYSTIHSTTTVTAYKTFTEYQPVTVISTATVTHHTVTKVTETATITSYATTHIGGCSTTTTKTVSVGYNSPKLVRAEAAQPLYAMEFN